MDLSCFFTLRIWRQSFLLTSFTIVLSFFFQAMTGSYIPFINFKTNLFEDTMHHYLKDTIFKRIWDADNLQSVSSGILDVYPELLFSFDQTHDKSLINIPNGSNICFQLYLFPLTDQQFVSPEQLQSSEVVILI